MLLILEIPSSLGYQASMVLDADVSDSDTTTLKENIGKDQLGIRYCIASDSASEHILKNI